MVMLHAVYFQRAEIMQLLSISPPALPLLFSHSTNTVTYYFVYLKIIVVDFQVKRNIFVGYLLGLVEQQRLALEL